MKVLVPFGTRPEAIKLAPVVRALEARGIEVRTVATGQHFDPNMAASIWEEVGLRVDDGWDLPAGAAERAGAILTHALGELESPPDLVLVLGDTQTVPAFCLAARTHRIPVAHIEAGLRSFNETSLEEVNRRVAAATASFHLVPTALAADYLLAEGVAPERIRVVGNPVIDAIVATGIEAVPPANREGVLFTAHRATNVDDPERLERIVELLLALAAAAGPVVFPVHPRTRARLIDAGAVERLAVEGIEVTEPLLYLQLLERLASSRLVVTDSGGLQEEASWFGVPSVVLRHSTPRWEAVLSGAARLVGLDVEHAMEAARQLSSPEEQERIAALPCPFGDGYAGEKIAEAILDPEVAPLLRVQEHDYVGHTPPGGLEAVLFDLDDTLYSQEAWLEDAWEAVAEVVASIWSIDRDAFHDALSRAAADGSAQGGIIDRALAEIGAVDVPSSWRIATFRAFKPSKLDPYPGVREALEELRRIVPIGLVTDGDPQLQESKLLALGLQDAFDTVVFSDELGPLARKPSPEPFRLALAALHVEPRHAVYVGDNPHKDVMGAMAAGMAVVRVVTGEYANVPDHLPSWRRARDVVEAIELVRPMISIRRTRLEAPVEVDA